MRALATWATPAAGMALPDLRLLSIGPTAAARTGRKRLGLLSMPPDLLAPLVVQQLLDEPCPFRVGEPNKHPHDALEKYDEWCRHGEWRCDSTMCIDALRHLMWRYGWTSPTTSLVVGVVGTRTEPPGITIDGQLNEYMPIEPIIECLKEQASGSPELAPADPLRRLTLPQLRLLAELHAALYFREREQFASVTNLCQYQSVLKIYNRQWVRLPLTGRRAMEVGASFINLSYMNTPELTSVGIDYRVSPDVNVARWLPERLTDGTRMFASNSRFRALGVEEWTMRNLKHASSMFYGLSEFNGDLSKWEPLQLNSAQLMFHNCTAFEGRGLAKWASHVTSIADASRMFQNCRSLKLENLRNWQLTNKSVDVNEMLRGVTIHVSDEVHLNTMNVNRNCFYDWERVESVAVRLFGPSRDHLITTMLHRVVKRWKAVPQGEGGRATHFRE